MPRAVKWLLIGLAGLIGIFALALISVYMGSSARLNKTYSIEVADIALPTDAESIAQGRHIAVTRGCPECHGADLGGGPVIEGQPMGLIYAPNLTPAGITAGYSTRDWVRSIRHAVAPSGRPLVLMPSEDYFYLSDTDTGVLIAYLKSVEPVYRQPPPVSLGPLGRALVLADQLKLNAEFLPHEAPRPQVPTPGPTVAYGQYLSTTCIGCHGPRFSGGPIPGGDPSWPPARNITPDPETGIGTWEKADFFRALREGKLPDGSELDPAMPRAMGQMTDDELTALFLFLKQVPVREYGNR